MPPRVSVGNSRPRGWHSSAVRILFWITVTWAIAIVWLSRYPPMIDLPQHAGQVTLLHDLLRGRSAWAEIVQLNLFAPYLVAYGLSVLFSSVMPTLLAIKTVVSLAILAFVAMGLRLRSHFGADARLDWLLVPGCFGFAFKWGLLTFLVAAPLCMLFILLTDRYASQPSWRRGALVVASGFVLLVSHGLVFAFGWLVGLGLVLARFRRSTKWVRQAIPLSIVAAACLVYFFVSRRLEAELGVPVGVGGQYNWSLGRGLQALSYAFDNEIRLSLLAPAAALLVAPWLLGLRISRQRLAACVPLIAVLALFAAAPSAALKTAFLYQRFAIFLFPAYAWSFGAKHPGTQPSTLRRVIGAFAMAGVVLASWFVLSFHTINTWRFGKESADFHVVTQGLDLRQRALYLPFNPDSAADDHKNMYRHFGAWYQAEGHGFVDFNFAWFPPQLARFRTNGTPNVTPGFEWRPETFDWQHHDGDAYRYFLVRGHTAASATDIFRNAPCLPKKVAQQGDWSVYEREPCVASM